jgi:hypothetical protein
VLGLILPSDIPAQSSEEARVLAAFRTKLDSAVARVRNDSVLWQMQNNPPYSGMWVKRRCQVIDVAFDLQRTNSLVSPLMAIVTARTDELQSSYAQSREAIATAPARERVHATHKPTELRITYALQDSVWTLKSGEYRFEAADELLRRVVGPAAWKPLWETEKDKADRSFCAIYAAWAAMK